MLVSAHPKAEGQFLIFQRPSVGSV